jgi:hypothetical protein
MKVTTRKRTALVNRHLCHSLWDQLYDYLIALNCFCSGLYIELHVELWPEP